MKRESEAALRFSKFENMDDKSDASWNLVTFKKPSTRKSALFVGNLKATTTSDELKMFIARRAAEAQCLVQVFNCTIFQKETTSSARITGSSECANVISDRRFWPRPTYTRTRAFDKHKDTNGSDVQTAWGIPNGILPELDATKMNSKLITVGFLNVCSPRDKVDEINY